METETPTVVKPVVREIKKATSPLGVEVRASKYNIENQFLEKEKKEEEKDVVVDTSHLPKNHFSDIDLEKHWETFLEELKTKDYMIYLVVNSFKINKKDEQTIVFRYPSETVKQKFDESVRGEFLNSFQRKVHNYSIQAEYVKDKALKQEVLTKRKMFDKMVEFNPLLSELNDLLDFDFS